MLSRAGWTVRCSKKSNKKVKAPTDDMEILFIRCNGRRNRKRLSKDKMLGICRVVLQLLT